MEHFVLMLLTFAGGQPIQHQESAVFADFDTCTRVALAMRHADYTTGIIVSPYCKRVSGPIPSKLR